MLESAAALAATSRPDSRLRFDQRILLLALAAGLPAALVALILLWTGTYTPKVQWTLTVFIVGVWTGCSFSVRQRVVLPLQTLSNLLAALRGRRVSRRIGPLRSAADDIPPGRPAAPTARALGREPAVARRRAAGVAAADSRHRPRDQQLPGADQVDRRQPRVDVRAR